MNFKFCLWEGENKLALLGGSYISVVDIPFSFQNVFGGGYSDVRQALRVSDGAGFDMKAEGLIA